MAGQIRKRFGGSLGVDGDYPISRLHCDDASCLGDRDYSPSRSVVLLLLHCSSIAGVIVAVAVAVPLLMLIALLATLMLWTRLRNIDGVLDDHGHQYIAVTRLEPFPALIADALFSPVQEYFKSAVGGIKRADIVYGPGGVSRGIANVVFYQSDGASKAYQKLNGILVDNRPIKVSYRSNDVAKMTLKSLC